MSNFISEPEELPDFRFFVVAKDTFMSGWGKSEGRENWVILPCKNHKECQVVCENARNRTDMIHIHIRPKVGMEGMLRRDRQSTFSLFDREDADRWYQPGGFRQVEVGDEAAN
jgi:hypothetical protein